MIQLDRQRLIIVYPYQSIHHITRYTSYSIILNLFPLICPNIIYLPFWDPNASSNFFDLKIEGNLVSQLTPDPPSPTVMSSPKQGPQSSWQKMAFSDCFSSILSIRSRDKMNVDSVGSDDHPMLEFHELGEKPATLLPNSVRNKVRVNSMLSHILWNYFAENLCSEALKSNSSPRGSSRF